MSRTESSLSGRYHAVVPPELVRARSSSTTAPLTMPGPETSRVRSVPEPLKSAYGKASGLVPL